MAAYHRHLAYCDLAEYCGFLKTAAIIMAAASGRQFAGQEIRAAWAIDRELDEAVEISNGTKDMKGVTYGRKNTARVIRTSKAM